MCRADPIRRENTEKHGTASHGKETRNPHRKNEPVVMGAGLRSVEIIGLCLITL
jgi:hypothetical protein